MLDDDSLSFWDYWTKDKADRIVKEDAPVPKKGFISYIIVLLAILICVIIALSKS